MTKNVFQALQEAGKDIGSLSLQVMDLASCYQAIGACLACKNIKSPSALLEILSEVSRLTSETLGGLNSTLAVIGQNLEKIES